MKVLITGGGGFIGSHLVDQLISRKDEVMVVDNFSTGNKHNLTPNKNLWLVEWTIADDIWCKSAFTKYKPDAVIHAAASYKDPNDWEEDIRTNIVGTANVIRACQESGCKRLIYFNTALCYGLKPSKVPVPVDHPLNPSGTTYAITKTTGEQLIAMSGLDWVTFRLATAIGAKNISGPVPTFYKRLKAKQPIYVTQTKREMIFVDDLVKLVLLAVDGKGHGAYNASRGEDYHIGHVLRAVCQAMKLDVPPHDVKPKGEDDAYTICLDPSRALQDFGWKASTSLESAVESAVFWYEQYGIGETYTHLKLNK